MSASCKDAHAVSEGAVMVPVIWCTDCNTIISIRDRLSTLEFTTKLALLVVRCMCMTVNREKADDGGLAEADMPVWFPSVGLSGLLAPSLENGVRYRIENEHDSWAILSIKAS